MSVPGLFSTQHHRISRLFTQSLGHGLGDVDKAYFVALISGFGDRDVRCIIALRKPETFENSRVNLVQFSAAEERVSFDLWANL